jgi:putative thioredoxin
MSFNKAIPSNGSTNFSNVFDLSTLKKSDLPESPMPGVAVTQENLVSDFVSKSKEQVVVLLCWSPRSAQSKEILDILGKLESADKGAWLLGTVDVDSQPQVAQALQVKAVPIAIAIVAEQLLPLFESVPQIDQVRLVINKLLELAAQKGVGQAPEVLAEIPLEPEEQAAYAALEKSDFKAAKIAYESWLKRKPNEPVAVIGLAQVDLMLRVDGLDPELTLKSAKSDDLTSQLMCADIEIATGNNEAAFTRLLNVIRSFSGDEKEKAKLHLIQLFNLVNPSDPSLLKARNELASLLF